MYEILHEEIIVFWKSCGEIQWSLLELIMSIIRCFSRSFLSPLYGVLVVVLMSPLFGVFSYGLLGTETAATSGKVNQRAA